jgi:hypothetical protein
MKKTISDFKENRFRNLINSRGMIVDEKEKKKKKGRGRKEEGSTREGEETRKLSLSPHYFLSV